MAILKMFAVRDSKIEAYMRPSFVQNEAVMRRSCEHALFDENHPFSLAPQDYQVFYLGEFDENTGKLTPVAPEHVFNIVDLKGAE